MMNDDQTNPDAIANDAIRILNAPPPTHDEFRAALKRIRLILDTNAHWLDDRSYIISTNHELDDAYSFVRDHLDTDDANLLTVFTDDFYYEHLTKEHAASILNDLQTLWAYPYARDEISNIAMSLSLCPMHFCDWAACFDDEDDECSAIRAIFPHSHDT